MRGHISRKATISHEKQLTPAFHDCALAQADTQEMPNVDDYIARKAAVYRLQQEMVNWDRKVRIQFHQPTCMPSCHLCRHNIYIFTGLHTPLSLERVAA